VSETLGLVLLHFLWQGALVGVSAAVLLRAAQNAKSSTRYAIGVLAMAALLAAPVATFEIIVGHAGDVQIGAYAIDARRALDASPSVRAGVRRAVADLQIGRSAPAAQARLGQFVSPRLKVLSLSLLLSAWLSGVLLLSLRLAGGRFVATRLTRRAVSPVASDIGAMARRAASRLSIRRVVRVLESSAVHVPTVVGWLKPVVLVPAAVLSGLTSSQLEALLAHEFAHVKRHDYLVNVLQSVVETVLFYHPAVWWVSKQIRIEREHCCDDIAVEICGDRVMYVAALRDLETLRVTPSLALAASDGSLVARVRRLLAAPRERTAPSSGWMGVALIAVLVAALMPAAFAS
jgi:beta-lactamase regulating signal transducer with metallopeptidase domain